MAASYSAINVFNTTVADIVTALTAKSLITENHYQDATNLIFTSPISSKFIKLAFSSGMVTLSYGDGHTTSTLTGTVVVISAYYSTPYATGIHMIADTTWFALMVEASSSGGDTQIVYYGITDSSKEIAFGMYCNSTYWSYATNICKNITDGTTMYPVVFSAPFNDAGIEYTQGLMWRDASSGQILKNGANPAITVGVKNISMAQNSIIKAPTYITSQNPAFMTGHGQIRTALVFDFS